jgi:FTR1 family protein
VLSAFLVALREGVEAALVVGIILVYLSRTGRAHLAGYAWGGAASAVALSLAATTVLERFQIGKERRDSKIAKASSNASDDIWRQI